MKRLTMKRLGLLALAALMLVLAVLAAPGLWRRFFVAAVVSNALIGQTEAQIRSAYGQPAQDAEGYHRPDNPAPSDPPPGQIRTLNFHPRGLLHLEGGTLVVWVRKEGDDWICFESLWYADGVNF